MGWTMQLCEKCIEELKERGEEIRITNQRDCNCYNCEEDTDNRTVYDVWIK